MSGQFFTKQAQENSLSNRILWWAFGIKIGYLDNIDPQFLASQKDFWMLSKDFYTLAQVRKAEWVQRFSNPDQTTTLVAVDHLSPNMASVATMDPYKTTELQKNDSNWMVKRLQEIMAPVVKGTPEDQKQACMERNKLLGHSRLPAQVVIAGDNVLSLQFYTTNPMRGPLFGIKADKRRGGLARAIYDYGVGIIQKVICGETIERKSEDGTTQEPIVLSPARNMWGDDLSHVKEDLRAKLG
ncbi:MAG: hypothetical protein P4M13_07310 [Alphaproteobacteria bacterium]|nr:hypothetical protein [Alphaproteobacteria bacterium]